MNQVAAAAFLKGWLLGAKDIDPELKEAIKTVMDGPREYVTLEKHRAGLPEKKYANPRPPELVAKPKIDPWADRAEAVRKLVTEEHMTDLLIGERYGVAESTIGDMRKRFGIPSARSLQKQIKPIKHSNGAVLDFSPDNL